MSFGSDIRVFTCMGLVLVDLFDEWVYDFYKTWLTKVYLVWKFRGFELYFVIDGKSNFYCLFGASGGFTLGVCNGGYCYICCFMGLLKMVCIYCGRNS